MEVIQIKKSDEKEIYKLAAEENLIFKKFTSHPIYCVKFNKKLFRKLFKNYFGKNKLFIGIKEYGQIVALLSGYIKPAPRGDVGYIDNLFVSSKYLGRGYATVLKEEYFRWLRSKKIKYCQLDVLAKNPAKRIYERWGFSVDALRMTRKL